MSSQSCSARVRATAVFSDGASMPTGTSMLTSPKPKRLEALRRAPAIGLPVDAAEAAGRVPDAHRDVLDGVQRVDEAEILVDEADAGGLGFAAVAEVQGLAGEFGDRAGVGLVESGEDLDERRLTGTVLTDEGMRAPGADLDVEVVERDLPGKRFGEVAHDQQVGH